MATDPVNEEIDELTIVYKMLRTQIEAQERELEETAEIIKGVVYPNEFTVIDGNWIVDNISADEVTITENVTLANDTIMVGDVPWTTQDSLVYLPFVEEQIEELEDLLKKLIKSDKKKKEKGLKKPRSSEEDDDEDDDDDVNENDLHRIKRAFTNANSTLVLNDIKLENVQFDFINGEPASDLIFRTEKNLVLNGTVTFKQPLTVENNVFIEDNKINGMVIGVDIKHVNSTIDELVCSSIEILDNIDVEQTINNFTVTDAMSRFFGDKLDTLNDTLEIDSLIVDGNLNVGAINGVNFNELLQNVVYKSLPQNIDTIIAEVKKLFYRKHLYSSHCNIFQNVIMKSNVTTKMLNGWQFPDDYLLTKGPSVSVVTGFMIFKGKLCKYKITLFLFIL